MKYLLVCSTAVILAACMSGPQVRLDLDNLPPGEEVVLFNGVSLAGWKVTSGIFYEDSGDVTARDGILTLDMGSPMTGLRWKGSALREEFEIRLQGRRVEGNDFFCGLTFPVKTGYVTLILGGWDGTVVGLSDIDGFNASTNLTTQNIAFEKGRWYDIRVRVTKQLVTVYLDGKKIIEHGIDNHNFEVWPHQKETRPIGLTTYNTRGEYRRIRYKRL